jgi:hypothetical protein
MNVASYTFQSPYSSPVQVGRLDPSSTKEETNTSQKAPLTNETQQKAQNFASTQTQEVTPSVEATPLLDVYA